MKQLCLIIFAGFLSIGFLHAQTKVTENVNCLNEGAKSPTASLNDVSWITGRWTGPGLDGLCEEIWAPAYNNHMIGTFRMIETEKFMFFAFADLVEENGSLSMKVKHFNYKLEGREEKDEFTQFPLVQITTTRIYFDGMTMEKVGDDGMTVYMMVQHKNGETKEEKYTYKKSWAMK